MAQDQLDALVARLASDPGFAAALAAAATAEDAQRVAAEHGFGVTPGELDAATSASELSDADLEGVAGGGTRERITAALGFADVTEGRASQD